MKSLNEGIRALMLWTGYHFDLANNSNDKNIINNCKNVVALMTPILKSFATDVGCYSSNLALQIYGGHGYIKDHGIEQFVRDARIAPIYEGTNGIQALDLINRKMQINDGEIINNFFKTINNYLSDIAINKNIIREIEIFKKSYDELILTTKYIKSLNTKEELEINGAAVEYLEMFSYIAIGFMWLKILEISYTKNLLNKSEFYESKIETGKFYFKKIIPKTSFLKNHILSGASNYNDYKDKYFDLGFI
tara:strand:- start:1289 stop:2035 length:747 start_codon:yes stop_codon:yes gene_type:complete